MSQTTKLPNSQDARGPKPRPDVLYLKGQPRLPSVEAQTLAFVEYAQKEPEPMSALTEWAGFSVYLRYARNKRLTEDLSVGECIAISSIHIPEHLQHRGWFWRYCQMCLCLVSDALIIENVHNPSLRAALRQRPEFLEYIPTSFVLRRTLECPWPLRVFQSPT